jgi:hypothetical protein
MNVVQYVLGILAALFTLTVVVEMLRRRRLRERHAMWWLVAGLLALLIAVFPDLLEGFSAWLGFSVPVNLVFFVSLFILFLVALQHSWELTKLEDHNRKLVERIVILELRTEKLEAKKPARKPSRTKTGH